MIRLSLRQLSLALGVLAIGAVSASAGNWPQWRGPDGTSASTETNLPTQWSKDAGIAWKCLLPDEGASTPAIWGNAIFLTAQQGEKLLLLKIRKNDGTVEWTRAVGSGTMRRGLPKRTLHTFHNLHNMASPSPVTDGELVVVHFGNGDLAAYDFAGKRLWLRNLQKEHGPYTIWWGHANSPVIFKDLVISVCMQDSLADLQKTAATSYLVAHGKRTGEQKWKTFRMTGVSAEDCDAYTTPLFHAIPGSTEMIVMGANQIDAYDPATGKQRWFLPGLKGSRTITGPTLGNGLVYAIEGKRGAVFALKLGGTGKLGPDAIAWRQGQSTPDSPCPVLWKDLLFMVTDDGFATCRDAKTGDLKWKERLPGNYKASPLAADGKVYFLNLAGTCTVLAASAKFKTLAANSLDDATAASPAVSDGHIYLRGKKTLYCVGRK